MVNIAQGASNAHEEIKRVHRALWKGLFTLLLIRVITFMMLINGHAVLAIFIDYMLLVPIYFYISQPIVAEAILAWSLFVAIKRGDIEVENEIPNVLGKLNGIILNMFAFVFLAPDTIGALFPNGIPVANALLVVGLGIGCGIITVLMEWKGKLFLHMIFAANIAMIILALLPGIDFGSGDIATESRDFLLEYRGLLGIIIFLVTLGIFRSIWGAGGSLWEKTKWLFHPKNFLGVVGSLLIMGVVLYLVFSYLNPTVTVRFEKWRQDNHKEADEIATTEGVKMPAMDISPSFRETSDSKVSSERKKIAQQGGILKQSSVTEQSILSCKNAKKVTDMEYTPTHGMLAEKPLLATVDTGKYLLEASGNHCQGFFTEDNVSDTPTHCRWTNPDGVMDDGTTWITEGMNPSSPAPFASKPYGAIVYRIGEKSIFGGSRKVINIKGDSQKILLDLNVFQAERTYNGNGSFKIKLSQCS